MSIYGIFYNTNSLISIKKITGRITNLHKKIIINKHTHFSANHLFARNEVNVISFLPNFQTLVLIGNTKSVVCLQCLHKNANQRNLSQT